MNKNNISVGLGLGVGGVVMGGKIINTALLTTAGALYTTGAPVLLKKTHSYLLRSRSLAPS